MASQLNKFHSNYIKRKIHKRLSSSIITERDWVTIGERQRLGVGKQAVYGDGNFIFSTSSFPNTKKRHSGNQEFESFTYEDVKNANHSLNQVDIDVKSDDMRDFAYYGSCEELVRSSVENIINTFPPYISSTGLSVSVVKKITKKVKEIPEDYSKEYLVDTSGRAITDTSTWEEMILLSNPFGVDIYNREVELTELDNPIHYMFMSYSQYGYSKAPTIVYNELSCVPDDGLVYLLATVTFEDGNVVYVCQCGDEYIYATKSGKEFKTIAPTYEIYREYFDNLDGFEKLLLNDTSAPLFSNVLITPLVSDQGVKYVKRRYTWPSFVLQLADSEGNSHECGFINVDGSSYLGMVGRLADAAAIFDTDGSDNLYSRMTHETIKRFDWSNDKNSDENDVYLEGNARMEQIAHVMGRVFDDILRHINGIKATSRVSYDGICNVADSLLSDMINNAGWEVKSIIPNGAQPEDKVSIDLFESLRTQCLSNSDIDTEFQRRLLLVARQIGRWKGTRHGLEMALALFGLVNGRDYTVSEEMKQLSSIPGAFRGLSEEEVDVVEDKIRDYSNRVYRKYYTNGIYGGEDEFLYPGVPLKEVSDGNGKYDVIPFHVEGKHYFSDLYFQSKGGWLYDGSRHNETVPYLKVVSSCNELSLVPSVDVSVGEIYYVASLGDFGEVFGNDLTDEEIKSLSHMFVRNAVNGETGMVWKNVGLLEDATEYNGKKGSEIKAEAMYVESVVSDNDGNNPHVGYGGYDNGDHFFQVLSQPYREAIFYDNDSYADEAKNIKFDFTTVLDTDKVVLNDLNTVKANGTTVKVGKIHYYNSKVVNLTFKVKLPDDYYNIVLFYATQMVPSTAILKITKP